MDKSKKTFGLQESTAKFIGACYKKGPDILALQVQTVQPELVGVNLVCLQNLRSITLPNEQFVSYYGIRHIIA